MRSEDHWVATSGGRLFARSWNLAGRAGSPGPTLLLVHDSLGSVELWRDFPERLAEATSLPVVAYDRLGFGRSDARSGQMADDFVEAEAAAGLLPVADRLGCAMLVPTGHSVGGGMAVAAAAQHPKRCSAVIALATQAFLEEHTLAGLRAAREAFGQPGQVERLARYHGAKAAWVLGAWFDTWLRESFSTYALDRFLSGLRCPLLVLSGDRDEYVSLRNPARMEAMAGGPVETHILEGCGHVLHRERPDQVLEVAARFLAAHLRPAA